MPPIPVPTPETSALALHELTEYASWFIDSWSTQVKKNAAAVGPDAQTLAARDSAALAVSSLVTLGISIAEAITILVEPPGGTLMVEDAYQTTTSAGTRHLELDGDLLRTDDPTLAIPKADVTITPSTLDPQQVGFVVSFDIDGVAPGAYMGEVKVLKSDGSAAEPPTTVILVV
jgi:hypothetical protein